MNVETNYAIVIAALSDWLQNLMLVFQPMKSKTKHTLCIWFFSLLQVMGSNSGRLIVLFAHVVIGGRNYFGIGFSTVIYFNNRFYELLMSPVASCLD